MICRFFIAFQYFWLLKLTGSFILLSLDLLHCACLCLKNRTIKNIFYKPFLGNIETFQVTVISLFFVKLTVFREALYLMQCVLQWAEFCDIGEDVYKKIAIRCNLKFVLWPFFLREDSVPTIRKLTTTPQSFRNWKRGHEPWDHQISSFYKPFVGWLSLHYCWVAIGWGGCNYNYSTWMYTVLYSAYNGQN